MFNGTERFPANELIKVLSRFGAEFGPDVNAYTSYQETVYEIELATDDIETVETDSTSCSSGPQRSPWIPKKSTSKGEFFSRSGACATRGSLAATSSALPNGCYKARRSPTAARWPIGSTRYDHAGRSQGFFRDLVSH